MTRRKVTGEKVTVENEGGRMGHGRKEVRATGGEINGRKEVIVYVTKGKSIIGMMRGR